MFACMCERPAIGQVVFVHPAGQGGLLRDLDTGHMCFWNVSGYGGIADLLRGGIDWSAGKQRANALPRAPKLDDLFRFKMQVDSAGDLRALVWEFQAEYLIAITQTAHIDSTLA